MIKDKINEIINQLIDRTKSGNLVWNESDKTSPTKRNWERVMYCFGEDNTLYEIDIKFFLNGEKWLIESSPSMFIRSENLPMGYIFAFGGTYNLVELRDLIINNFCKDMNPTVDNVEDILENIKRGISIETYRNTKIESLIN